LKADQLLGSGEGTHSLNRTYEVLKVAPDVGNPFDALALNRTYEVLKVRAFVRGAPREDQL